MCSQKEKIENKLFSRKLNIQINVRKTIKEQPNQNKYKNRILIRQYEQEQSTS